MSEDKSNIYEFGSFRLDVGRRLLLRRDDGQPLKLTSKAFDTLLYMVRHGGSVLDKDELMRAIWPDTVVEENNLSQNVSALRRVLGEKQGDNRYIVTVPGRGFSFVAPVTSLPGESPPVIKGELPELGSKDVSNLTGPAGHQSSWNRARFIILGHSHHGARRTRYLLLGCQNANSSSGHCKNHSRAAVQIVGGGESG